MKKIDGKKLTPGVESLLVEQVNKLIDEVIYLRKEVERLDKVKAKRTVIMGGMRES